MSRPEIYSALLTKEFLEKEYVEKNRSGPDIAKQLGCTSMTVLRYVRKFNLKSKPIIRHGDITGQKFNYLTAIKRVKTTREQKTTWLCKCDCGEEIEVYVSRLIGNKTRSCGCKLKGNLNPNYTGTVHISSSYWNSIVRGAKERGYDFQISIEDAEKQYVKQLGICALTGINLFPCESRHSSGKWTASLDRKNSGIGYTIDNIQWVHKDINRMKWHYNQEYFIELCSAVHNNFNKDN